MAKTSFIQIPAGMETAFYNVLTPGDRFTFPRLRRVVMFNSKKRIKGMTVKSLLPQISATWNSLSQAQQEAWETAAAEMGQKAYKLFTQDHAIRLKNQIAGVATPSVLHQSWAGKMMTADPADDITIAQYHPATYWTSRKVRGYDRREPVKVTELVSLPLSLAISYKSNLTAMPGQTPKARYFAEITSLYQGRNIVSEVAINFDLVSDWSRVSVNAGPVLGAIKGYTIFLQLENVRGSLWFDNVSVYHSGQNWARDPYCNNIRQTFTRVYFQVPRHWAAVELPNGSFYDSVYPEA